MAQPVLAQKGKEAVRALKQAEKAHRNAARAVAQWVESMEALGFKVEFKEGGTAENGTAKVKRPRQG